MTEKEVKKRELRSREKDKYQKTLIERIGVFNVGWFGIPKANWKTAGFAISVLGAIFLITGNVITIPTESTTINITGFVLLGLGLLITLANG